ncbi:MAG: DNA repair protein RadA/Sms [Saprospiraceae bacterium]|jgi:DNA repair protein RadA/Sms
MAKSKTVYLCTDCGSVAPKWAGQCGDCGEWNTLIARVEQGTSVAARHAGLAPDSSVIELKDVDLQKVQRLSTHSAELDRVLGGGVVPGSVILLGGDPGIGKSTLLTQYMAKMNRQQSVLYTSGEESAQQIAIRAKRLGEETQSLKVMAENRLEPILQAAQKTRPDVLVVDSIQTVYTEAIESAPGSVTQVRECAARLVRYAKQNNCAVMLVGHVTKEGSLAGPRILEHMVDAVLYFEGDTASSFRLIRAIKNRFGAVNEIGVFAMTEEGLVDVSNPSAMFVSRFSTEAAGSVVLATQEGSRPLLVEVQALVDQSALGNPRRLCVGLEQNRLAMLLAILHRHGGLMLSDQDVFANVVGGIKVTETASDLAVVIALISSLLNRSIGSKLVAFGELGLTGEIRPVQGGQDRIKEARKLGFDSVMLPKANVPKKPVSDIKLVPVTHIQQVLEFLQSH